MCLSLPLYGLLVFTDFFSREIFYKVIQQKNGSSKMGRRIRENFGPGRRHIGSQFGRSWFCLSTKLLKDDLNEDTGPTATHMEMGRVVSDFQGCRFHTGRAQISFLYRSHTPPPSWMSAEFNVR